MKTLKTRRAANPKPKARTWVAWALFCGGGKDLCRHTIGSPFIGSKRDLMKRWPPGLGYVMRRVIITEAPAPAGRKSKP